MYDDCLQLWILVGSPQPPFNTCMKVRGATSIASEKPVCFVAGLLYKVAKYTFKNMRYSHRFCVTSRCGPNGDLPTNSPKIFIIHVFTYGTCLKVIKRGRSLCPPSRKKGSLFYYDYYGAVNSTGRHVKSIAFIQRRIIFGES